MPHRSAGPTGTLTILGTNDLHGALERVPLLAGFVANVRAARAADGGAVLLVDGGDLFQGTLESNLGEGVDVVRAYNALGYTASAIGNHEFDYGPVGPAVTAKTPDDDPRGALRARIGEAKFPFLAANIIDEATHARIDWPNTRASLLVTLDGGLAGVKVGIVGVSTEATPYTTMPANFKGLSIASPAETIAREAAALRAQGATIVIAIAHIGSECKDVTHPDAVSSCDKSAELFKVLGGLPKGAIDVFVAGHTHAVVAHNIDGVAVIESLSAGRAFGRVDLAIADGKLASAKISPPQLLCPLDGDHNPIPVKDCHPDAYEGRAVAADAAVQQIVDEAIAKAGERRAEKLGVTLAAVVTRIYKLESAEGDLFTELMLAASPKSQVALTNGGGLRADLPAGALTYGALFEAMPFDNHFAYVQVTGKQLRTLVKSNLQRGAGIFSWSGLVAKARCKGDELDVEIKVAGKPLRDDAPYTIATSDFLASGGDGALKKLNLPASATEMTDVIIRDAIADVLRKRKGTIDPAKILEHKRLDYQGTRPLRCGKGGGGDDEPEAK